MRMYGKKFLKNQVQKAVDSKREIRNGIVWSVDTDNQICNVRVQGSSKNIKAWYPENTHETPSWLKPGNAVTIVHNNARGRVEVIGHGQVIPAPVDGEDELPSASLADDAIISGLAVHPTKPASMTVDIDSGTVRFNDTTSAISATSKTIDTAPTDPKKFRYDIIAIGSDLVIDVVKGTEFQSSESVPAIPSGHLEIARILVQGGVTKIRENDINNTWSEPELAGVDISINDDDLAWDELSTQFTVTIIDQWGNNYNTSGTITVTFLFGNGKLYSSDTGWSTSQVTKTLSNASSYTFTYERNQLGTDISPSLDIRFAETGGVTYVNVAQITLRDESGNKMWA